MSEPQVWTVIGVFAASFFGLITLVSTLFLRVIRSEIGALRTELDSLRTEMRTRFEALDRDVQFLMNREFGVGRD